ncbi:MAG: hypothetical protein IKP64_13020 [Selenomonadaceae bacterium]|nr:hypothetical protein [Selenomonadaceae bacterium]MBR4384465.1 hypothetical protein [Selenomonadaceae bacterium]
MKLLANDQENLRREWAKFGVATVLYDDINTPNEYYIDGTQVTQLEAYAHVLIKVGKAELAQKLIK